eukprot:6094473-Pleurochrysis_carterae.AAC.1
MNDDLLRLLCALLGRSSAVNSRFSAQPFTCSPTTCARRAALVLAQDACGIMATEQRCDWLHDREDLRDRVPPLWCWDYSYEKEACERSYVRVASRSDGAATERLVRKCVFNMGTELCSGAEEIECGAILEKHSQPISHDHASYADIMRPPPLPVIAESQITLLPDASISPSAKPLVEALNPFSPAMRLQPPVLVNADCSTLTIAWAPPSFLTRSGVAVERYALYLGKGDTATEPWSKDLHHSQATITDLQPGLSYAVSISMQTADGWGPKSAPLRTTTPTSCDVSTAAHRACDREVSSVTRLLAPVVRPVNCKALILEMPVHPSDRCVGEELSVQMRVSAAEWKLARLAVQSGTVLLGELDPLQAYEFRVLLHRDDFSLPGKSTGPVVVEDAANSSIGSAPQVKTFSRIDGSGYIVTWSRATSLCRPHARFRLEAAAADQANWATVADRILGDEYRVMGRTVPCTRAGCHFRVVGLGINGWDSPGLPSRLAYILPHTEESAADGTAFILAAVCLVAIAGGLVTYKRQLVRIGREFKLSDVAEFLMRRQQYLAAELPKCLRLLRMQLKYALGQLVSAWEATRVLLKHGFRSKGGRYQRTAAVPTDDEKGGKEVIQVPNVRVMAYPKMKKIRSERQSYRQRHTLLEPPIVEDEVFTDDHDYSADAVDIGTRSFKGSGGSVQRI